MTTTYLANRSGKMLNIELHDEHNVFVASALLSNNNYLCVEKSAVGMTVNIIDGDNLVCHKLSNVGGTGSYIITQELTVKCKE